MDNQHSQAWSSEMSVTIDIVDGRTYRTTVALDDPVALSTEQIHILCGLYFALYLPNEVLNDSTLILYETKFTAKENSMDSDKAKFSWSEPTAIVHTYKGAATTHVYSVCREQDGWVNLSCPDNHKASIITLSFKDGLLHSEDDSPAIVAVRSGSGLTISKWFHYNKCYRGEDQDIPSAQFVTCTGEITNFHHNREGLYHRSLVAGPAVYTTRIRINDGMKIKSSPYYFVDGELYSMMPAKKISELTDLVKLLRVLFNQRPVSSNDETSLPSSPSSSSPSSLQPLSLASIPEWW